MIDRKSFVTCGIVGFILSSFVLMSTQITWAIAFAAGYGLFALNVFAITAVSSLLVAGVSNTSGTYDSKRSRTVGLVLGGIKLLVLMIGLYLALVYFRLPGIVFAIGALTALVILVGLFSVTYLKRLGQAGGSNSI